MKSCDGNPVADNLADYIRHESSSTDTETEKIFRRHALEQLVESRLGADMAAAARRLVAAAADEEGGSCSCKGSTCEDGAEGRGWQSAVDELMELPSFQLLQHAVEECSLQLSATSMLAADEESSGDRIMARSKKAKIPDTPPAAATTAPTSFSLFDLLDSQKGGASLFALPPRIMAHQIIETQGNKTASDNNKEESALELLEKADDMEDLSPDPESWEEIRKILYDGLLVNSTTAKGGGGGSSSYIDEQFRYLKVHQSLFDKCRGNNACNAQLWGLGGNLVGSILALSCQLEKESTKQCTGIMNLCWDVAHSLLHQVLPHLAVDHVVSCIGNEREIDRMLLGMCMILSNDFLASILGMMEPMAGWFEIWVRFVDHKRLLTILQASGLGGVMLRRSESRLGRSASSETICKMMTQSVGGSGGVAAGSTSVLAGVEHCNFLQSLSILRTILFHCGGSQEVVSLIHNQFTSETKDSIALASFLLPHGVASADDVQTLLEGVQKKQKHCTQKQNLGNGDAINSVLKPFCGVIDVKESNVLVDSNLEVLCTQTIRLIQQP
ncbi:hypothetical protein ACHAXR_009448 [Thalassiosira sp. AJA248-18]